MSEVIFEMVEFDLPQCAEFEKNEMLAKVYSFAACFTQWVDGEKRLGSTSKQVVAHRLLSAIDGATKISWRKSDWALVCELIESSDAEFVPTLTAKIEGKDDQVWPPPQFLARRYIAAILGAKPVGESVDTSNGVSVTSHNQSGGVTAAAVGVA